MGDEIGLMCLGDFSLAWASGVEMRYFKLDETMIFPSLAEGVHDDVVRPLRAGFGNQQNKAGLFYGNEFRDDLLSISQSTSWLDVQDFDFEEESRPCCQFVIICVSKCLCKISLTLG